MNASHCREADDDSFMMDMHIFIAARSFGDVNFSSFARSLRPWGEIKQICEVCEKRKADRILFLHGNGWIQLLNNQFKFA